jgi:hypothetical protein
MDLAIRGDTNHFKPRAGATTNAAVPDLRSKRDAAV